MRRRLEHEVLSTLWASPGGLTGAEVVEQLEPPLLAVTTVLTVLERLRNKSLVRRAKRGREFVYVATTSAAEIQARVMSGALDEAADRRLVLARFVEALTEADQSALRDLIDGERE